MDTYSVLRAFADSWFLIAMFTAFLAIAIWAFLPSRRQDRDNAAQIPFRDSIITDTDRTTAPNQKGRDA